MSSSNPPNPNTPPVFNNDAFGQGANPTIDTAYLNANYLRFPTAQGSETLQNIQVLGSASFNNTALPTSAGTIPASTDSSTKIPTTAWVQSAITGGVSSVLTGTIIAYAGNSVPTGYLLCDSTQYSTTTYPALFALLGYTYGGTGAFFNVPNLVNNFIKGATQSVGATESGLFTISNNNIQAATITSTDLGSSGNPFVAFNTNGGIGSWSYYKGQASGDGSVNVWTAVTTANTLRSGTNLVSAFNTTIGTATPTAITGNVPNYLMRYIIKT
jgi:microcystin-dependent protein